MADIDDILALPNGAHFFRADLHFHSFGASHDVRDATMTPGAIVKTALAEGLQIIALTDHNDISNVASLLAAAKSSGLFVVPAVELSTSQGHLLCYLPTIENLTDFMGRLEFAHLKTAKSHCKNAILDCLDKLNALKGFGVLAHVDGDGGFDTIAGAGSPYVEDIICHSALVGIELKTSASTISYSDTDSTRAQLGRERIKKLALGSQQFLARLLNSDAHSLKALGKNAQGDSKVTRLKMDKPSFAALRIALEDADARVRLEEAIPDAVPQVLGLSVSGGFLDGVSLHLSPNLNCIIGGRGAGKSTTFEAIRCLIGSEEHGDMLDSEVWPEHLKLYWQDEVGERHSLQRPINGVVENVNDPLDGPTSFQIECYGQGDTARIRKEAQESPIALLSYLDRFIDIEKYVAEEDDALGILSRVKGEIDEAMKEVSTIPQTEQDLKTVKQQLAVLEKEKAKDVIALQRKLEVQRNIREQIGERLKAIKERLDEVGEVDDGEEIAALIDPSELAVGGVEFSSIVEKAKAFTGVQTDAVSKIKGAYDKLKITVDSNLAAWKAKETAALKAVDDKKKALEAQGIKLNMPYIERLTKNETRLTSNLKILEKWKVHLSSKSKEFNAATKARWAARSRIVAARNAYAKQASETLDAVIRDLSVGLKFLPSSYSPEAEEIVVNAMSWRTSKVPRAALMIEQLTLPGLLLAIEKNDFSKLQEVVVSPGVKAFTTEGSKTIIKTLSAWAIRSALQQAEVFDLPKLTITGFTMRAGKKTPAIRNFTRLSFGQQQSILLALMLSSKSNLPLIVDQPEDNLDSEFVYKTLVPVLRLAKERRQIIIVTHNANIAVLGDAEQIVVLKSTNEKASVVGQGSIDDPSTCDAACAVLEGAKEAFTTRAKIYGVL